MKKIEPVDVDLYCGGGGFTHALYRAALSLNLKIGRFIAVNHWDSAVKTLETNHPMGRRRGQGKIVWPEPTHAAPAKIAASKTQTQFAFSAPNIILKPHVAAREIIDWSLKGESVFNRKKPLSPNTMRRIYAGLEKFALKDFVLSHARNGGNQPRSVDKPIDTIVASPGNVKYLVSPFVLGQQTPAAPRSVDSPLPTIATDGAISLIESVIVQFNNHCDANSIDAPLRTQTTDNHFGLAEYLIGVGGPQGQQQPRSVNIPFPSQTKVNHHALAQPFILAIRGGDDAYTRGIPVDAPLPTITTQPGLALVVPVNHGGGPERVYPVDQPLNTLTTAYETGLAEYIIEFRNGKNNEKRTRSVDAPLPTQDTSNRFGLCSVKLADGDTYNVLCLPIIEQATGKVVDHLLIDILFRMLQPHELAAAMSFPKSYQFVSAKPFKQRKRQYPTPPQFAGISADDAVKMIGNACPGETTYNLCYAQLATR